MYYFGEYARRPTASDDKINIYLYNVVDPEFFAPGSSFVAGFFSTLYRNTYQTNVITVDNEILSYGGDEAEHVVAHELLHLIQADHYPDETWMQEGIAELAAYLAGYASTADDGYYSYFMLFNSLAPVSLTGFNAGILNYGFSSFFQRYLFEQYGGALDAATGRYPNAWTRSLLDDPRVGIASVEYLTGRSMDDLFRALLMAIYYDDTDASYKGLPLGFRTVDTNPLDSVFYGPVSVQLGLDLVAQYPPPSSVVSVLRRLRGGDAMSGASAYLPFSPNYRSYRYVQNASVNLGATLVANTFAGLLPYDGNRYAWSSNVANLCTANRLTLNAPVRTSLEFRAWWSIEEDWDFAFVEYSSDSGATWSALTGSITRLSTNPFRSAAWNCSTLAGQSSTNKAITGSSGGAWVLGSFALPSGSDGLVRFVYYSDAATNLGGIDIDSVVAGTASGVPLTESFEGTLTPGRWTFGGAWSVASPPVANWTLGIANPVYANAGSKAGDAPVSIETQFISMPTSTDVTQVMRLSANTNKLANGYALVVFSPLHRTNPAYANSAYFVASRP